MAAVTETGSSYSMPVSVVSAVKRNKNFVKINKHFLLGGFAGLRISFLVSKLIAFVKNDYWLVTGQRVIFYVFPGNRFNAVDVWFPLMLLIRIISIYQISG